MLKIKKPFKFNLNLVSGPLMEGRYLIDLPRWQLISRGLAKALKSVY